MNNLQPIHRLIFMKSRALRNVNIKMSLELLEDLMALYPNNYNIMKDLSEVYFESHLYKKCIKISSLLYLKTGDLKALKLLLASSLFSKKFLFYFKDLNIQKKLSAEFLKIVIKILLKLNVTGKIKKIKILRFNNMIVNNLKVMGIYTSIFDSRYDLKCLKIYLDKNLKYQSDCLRYSQYDLKDINNDNQFLMKRNELSFENSYKNILYLLIEGNLKDGLDALLEVFAFDSYFDLLEFLYMREYLVILHILSLKHPIFEIYFKKAKRKIIGEYRQILYSILIKESKLLVRDFLRVC